MAYNTCASRRATFFLARGASSPSPDLLVGPGVVRNRAVQREGPREHHADDLQLVRLLHEDARLTHAAVGTSTTTPATWECTPSASRDRDASTTGHRSSSHPESATEPERWGPDPTGPTYLGTTPDDAPPSSQRFSSGVRLRAAAAS